MQTATRFLPQGPPRSQAGYLFIIFNITVIYAVARVRGALRSYIRKKPSPGITGPEGSMHIARERTDRTLPTPITEKQPFKITHARFGWGAGEERAREKKTHPARPNRGSQTAPKALPHKTPRIMPKIEVTLQRGITLAPRAKLEMRHAGPHMHAKTRPPSETRYNLGGTVTLHKIRHAAAWHAKAMETVSEAGLQCDTARLG